MAGFDDRKDRLDESAALGALSAERQAHWSELLYGFRMNYAACRQDCGDPIDWRFAGTRRIGTVFCQTSESPAWSSRSISGLTL